LVYCAITFLTEMKDTVVADVHTLFTPFCDYVTKFAEVDKFCFLPVEQIKPYLELFKLSLLQIKLDGGAMVAARDWGIVPPSYGKEIPMLNVAWCLGAHLQPSAPSIEGILGKHITTPMDVDVIDVDDWRNTFHSCHSSMCSMK